MDMHVHYVGPDIYQYWNFEKNPSFSYSKNTLDDKNLNLNFNKIIFLCLNLPSKLSILANLEGKLGHRKMNFF